MDWEDLDNLEFSGHGEPPHPFRNMPFSVMKDQMAHYHSVYPAYLDFRIKLVETESNYGGPSYNYVLQGTKK